MDEQLLPGQALDGTAEPLEGAVALRAVEVRDPLVVGVVDELVKGLLAKGILHVAAVAAGAEAQAAQFEAGLAEGTWSTAVRLVAASARNHGQVVSRSPPAAAAERSKNCRRLR